MSTFSVQRRNSGKKDANFFAGEEDSMMSVDIIFCVDVHMGLDPRPHAST